MAKSKEAIMKDIALAQRHPPIAPITDDDRHILSIYDDELRKLLSRDDNGQNFFDRVVARGVLDKSGQSEHDIEVVNKMIADRSNNSIHGLNLEADKSPHANVTATNEAAVDKQGELARVLFAQLAKNINKVLYAEETAAGKPQVGYSRAALNDLLKRNAVLSLPKEMPAKLYRGQYNHNPEYTDLGTLDRDDVDGGSITFVSPSQAVAAAYQRYYPYQQGYDERPSNYGDTVLEILTHGLDPELFVPDDSSTLAEIMFGPQYKYKGSIPQEDIEITDQAGNTRIVPRIQNVPFYSDANLKEVVFPKHIIDGLVQKYG